MWQQTRFLFTIDVMPVLLSEIEKKAVRCLHEFLGKSVPSSVKFLGHRDEEWIYIPMGINCIWGFDFGGKSQFQMRNKQALIDQKIPKLPASDMVLL